MASCSTTLPVTSLQCSMCLELYRDPRALGCGHTFCLACLQKQSKTATATGVTNVPHCALCRQPWSDNTIPDKFPSNDAVIKQLTLLPQGDKCALADDGEKHDNVEYVCLTCWDLLCKSCSEAHKKTKLTRNHVVKTIADVSPENIEQHQSRMMSMCEKHSEMEYVLFCERCEELICYQCFANSHRPTTPNQFYFCSCIDVNKADERFIKLLETSIELGQKRSNKLVTVQDTAKSHIKTLEDNKQTVIKQSEKLQREIRSTCDFLLKTMQACENFYVARIAKELDTLKNAESEIENEMTSFKTLTSKQRSHLPPLSCTRGRIAAIKESGISLAPYVTFKHEQKEYNIAVSNASLQARETFLAIKTQVESYCIQGPTFLRVIVTSRPASLLSAKDGCVIIGRDRSAKLMQYYSNGEFLKDVNIAPHQPQDLSLLLFNDNLISINSKTIELFSCSGEGTYKCYTSCAKSTCLTGITSCSVDKHNNIFIAVKARGIYKSTDEGHHWTLVLKSPDQVDYLLVANVGEAIDDDHDVLWVVDKQKSDVSNSFKYIYRLCEYTTEKICPPPFGSEPFGSFYTPRNRPTSFSCVDIDLEIFQDEDYVNESPAANDDNAFNSSESSNRPNEINAIMPSSLAFDGENFAYVSDSDANAVYAFNVRDKSRSQVLSADDGIEQPCKLAIDSKHQLLYVGGNSGKVWVFSLKDVKWQYTFSVTI